MRLASFEVAGRSAWGIVEEDVVIDIGAELSRDASDLRTAIAANNWTGIREAAGKGRRYPLASVTWLPVIPNPGKILCVGLNYESHRRETGRATVENPTIFVRFANSQVGHRANILRPRVSRQLDFEGELAVIIGRSGRYIAREQALQHVAGYACYNDATLRDWQQHTTQFTPGKNFPATGAFGPWMATADGIGDLDGLRLTTRLNGKIVQEAGLDQMIFDVPRLIEYCSTFTRLEPGDVIATGTPGGVGFKRDPPLYLLPGDIVEVAISGIGELVNAVADEAVF